MAMTLLLALALCAQPFRWDVPLRRAEIDVPARFVTAGIPNRMHATLSGMRADLLYWHFREQFLRGGLYVPPEKDQVKLFREPQLTAYDPERRISYTVILHPHTDGTTTVIMGEAYVGERTRTGSPDFAPVLPGARAVVTSNLEGPRAVTYLARATQRQVAEFYQETLVKAGYRQATPGLFVRGDEELRVGVTARERGEVQVAVLVRTVTSDPMPHDGR